jgi:hypothetical protein
MRHLVTAGIVATGVTGQTAESRGWRPRIQDANMTSKSENTAWMKDGINGIKMHPIYIVGIRLNGAS